MAKQKKKTSQSPLRNRNTSMLVLFLAPATLLYLMVFLYPSVRTVVMSFFKVEGVTDPVSSWQFNAGKNYIDAFNDTLFRSAMTNLGKLWLIGGVAVMLLALLYAVALTSGLRAKSFFRSVIYLPNLVSAVAMGTMWLYYAFSKEDYGLMNTILSWFGVDNVMWTDPAHKFWSMLIAYCFGMVGYHMLIFMSGIERIGNDFYEAATIEGANVFQKFFYITLPLLRGSIRTNLVMWTVSSVGFFIWGQVFDPVNLSSQTVMPLNYMYELVFGSSNAAQAVRNSGIGAAIGVMMAAIVVLVFALTNFIVKNDDVEL
ncbi:carbohydrate ABC transporter permease [Candidatus Allofournierella excrementavium]|uniref:carbohydrate ABC transporter permease n=3 Tax=Bacteria TaxID=2 RepID=UPI003AF43AEA